MGAVAQSGRDIVSLKEFDCNFSEKTFNASGLIGCFGGLRAFELCLLDGFINSASPLTMYSIRCVAWVLLYTLYKVCADLRGVLESISLARLAMFFVSASRNRNLG